MRVLALSVLPLPQRPPTLTYRWWMARVLRPISNRKVAMNITEGITQIVFGVLQQAGVVPVNSGTSTSQESNSNIHVSRLGPPFNVREENPPPSFNHHYHYPPSNRRPRTPYRNPQHHPRFHQPHQNTNSSSYNNSRYRKHSNFQTTHNHHHWYHQIDESQSLHEKKEAYVHDTSLFIIETCSRVPPSYTAGTSSPPKASTTNLPTQTVPPPDAAVQPPPPPPPPASPPPVHVRSASPTQDWEQNYADIVDDL
ncbi:hypothetical protein IW261DRAFT_980267 [Armillaria novae-zelandiae]|uniref:Uncharacterized protein n=1 Tax=Armillaria novae-zelandiae TaxID=153914 RepID=A0AA39UI85_9AGAR|nr:hypothetical protein IW261DRAFT_980267 [Armillaria novae-zelandiae]